MKGAVNSGARRIFISHSQQDEEFAAQLDATFLASGAVTFFAERDRRASDSILEKLYSGLNTATDVNLAVGITHDERQIYKLFCPVQVGEDCLALHKPVRVIF